MSELVHIAYYSVTFPRLNPIFLPLLSPSRWIEMSQWPQKSLYLLRQYFSTLCSCQWLIVHLYICMALQGIILFHHFSFFSLLFCSSPLSHLFQSSLPAIMDFLASFLSSSVCWPSILFVFVYNVVTFVHYPGFWLPAALFCDLTAAFPRMGPFTWAAEHG